MKKSAFLSFSVAFLWVFFLFFPSPMRSQVPLHEKIVLKGSDGSPLTAESKLPYSPKKTCGGCHDYDQITKGYHFQQGRTDGAGKIIVSDTFDLRYPWNLSSGMYGKYCVASADSSQLAKIANTHSSEIDKSSYYFVQNCGLCHPGGGFGEYDRKGNLYYDLGTKKFGYEISGYDPILDGDYTPLTMGNINYGSSWDRSGLSEADCLLCHLKGFQWKERGATLRGGLFKYGPTVGAGWATIILSQGAFEGPRVEEVKVDYTKKEVADFENLHLQIVRSVPDENCWFCHASSDGKKRGQQWSPETDIHKSKGLNCITCHPADKEHNFAKGNTIQETVRDDLDNTMHSCEDCHYRGRDKRAPKYSHPFSPRHMKRIACQTCHIPFKTTSADLVYDLTTGSATVYETSKFLPSDPLDPQKWMTELGPNAWYPTIREFKGRIVPVKSLTVIYWGDLDEETLVVKPILLWKIRGLKKPPLKDNNGDGVPEINSLDEIKTFLIALREKDKFGSPVATRPVLVKGGFLYRLDEKGEVEKIKNEQAQNLDFSLSHNIVSGSSVIGSRGCQDCHSKDSPFFLRKVLIDPYDEKGKPVYIETWERLGIDREKLERLLSVQ
jgi:hypothetical protein